MLPAQSYVEGMHFMRRMYVNQGTVENGDPLLVALILFAEFQHHPEGGGLINSAVFQGGIGLLIRSGLWDWRTALGIAALIAAHPIEAAAAIASDPSLGVPSREPVLVTSASRDSWFAYRYGGGIAVEYEAGPLSRMAIKTMVTLPGEYVAAGKYETQPEVSD